MQHHKLDRFDCGHKGLDDGVSEIVGLYCLDDDVMAMIRVY